MTAQPPANTGKQKEITIDGGRDNLPWVEKYRPDTLNDVVSHQDIISTIDKFIQSNRLPHLLFYGPPGTGKTSTILAVAKKIYGTGTGALKNNILELNASDDRGIDTVREQIKNFASTRIIYSGSPFKLIILDEADMMTQQAQSALRRVIEQYTRNVRFCIICNYVNRIIPAIQSRCTRFRFGPLKTDQVQKRLLKVIEAESIQVTEDGMNALLKLTKGDMRRALNVLQACHGAYDQTDETAVYNCTGSPHPKDIASIVDSMMNEEFQTSFNRISAIKAEKGLALQDLIAGIFELIQTLVLPPSARIYILDNLAQIEHRLSTGSSEKLQLTGLLSVMKVAVQLGSK
ncbi:DNA replication factor [Atractiella rhizophila]|nr:DNA replication factor [Atractiella rhizophila]